MKPDEASADDIARWMAAINRPAAPGPPLIGPAGWYAVRTNARQEATAALNLTRERLGEVFFPRCMVEVRHARKVSSVLRPHLTSYVFVRTALGLLDRIRTTVGVGGIVGVAGHSIVIPDPIIDRMRTGFDRDGLACKVQAKPLPFKAGDVVKVAEGPFAGFSAEVEALDPGGELRLLIDVFGRSCPVTMLADWVETISPRRAERARNRA